MPAGMVRPRASLVPDLGVVATAEYLTAGWQISPHGRVGIGGVLGPCGVCRELCVRYGPRGSPLCPECRRPP